MHTAPRGLCFSLFSAAGGVLLCCSVLARSLACLSFWWFGALIAYAQDNTLFTVSAWAIVLLLLLLLLSYVLVLFVLVLVLLGFVVAARGACGHRAVEPEVSL